MKRLIATAILAIAALAGCASTPQNPQQAVYAAHGTYTVALTAAVKYKALPACTPAPAPLACKKPEVVAQLQKADDTAYAALSAAQKIVRAPEGGGVVTAIFNAEQAVGAFAAIARTLGGAQ
jgi:starvation-inducible outer membrane lipoprotein